jgi:hypothetical protein
MSAATVPQMKFSQFVDFILVRLYQLEQTRGAGRYFSLNEIARELKEEMPRAWIRDAGKVLQSRRLAEAIFMVGGNAQAQLTGEGRLWVEEGRGKVPEIQKDLPRIMVNISGANNQVSVAGGDQSQITQTIEQEREPVFQLIDQIGATLEKDSGLSDQQKKEMLVDVAAVRGQLEKREPNRSVLAAILEPLSQTTSIASLVAELIKLINP